MRTPLLALFLAVSAAAQTAPANATERGWQVLEAGLKAAGGREKLEAVQDYSFELQSHVIAPQGDLDVRSENRFVFPSTFRLDSHTPFGEQNVAGDGKFGWTRAATGIVTLPPEELTRIAADLARSNVLFRPPRDRSRVKWVAEDTIDGKACDVIEISEVGGAPLRLSIERRSGDFVKRGYRADTPGARGVGSVEAFMSDYRTVGGLRLAFRVRVMLDGKLVRESVTEQFQINSGLDPQELLRRPGA